MKPENLIALLESTREALVLLLEDFDTQPVRTKDNIRELLVATDDHLRDAKVEIEPSFQEQLRSQLILNGYDKAGLLASEDLINACVQAFVIVDDCAEIQSRLARVFKARRSKSFCSVSNVGPDQLELDVMVGASYGHVLATAKALAKLHQKSVSFTFNGELVQVPVPEDVEP